MHWSHALRYIAKTYEQNKIYYENGQLRQFHSCPLNMIEAASKVSKEPKKTAE